MKHLFISLFLTVACLSLAAQGGKQQINKPLIDSSVYSKWPSISEGSISNNGRYVSYTINNRPIGSQTLVLKSAQAKWKMEIEGINGVSFTPDGSKAIFIKTNDSLCIVTLGHHSVSCIPSVSSFKLPKANNTDWLIYQLEGPEKKLVIRNFKTKKERIFSSVNNYWPVEDGHSLVIQVEAKHDSIKTQSLKWVTLADGNSVTFWEGQAVTNLIFDKKHRQLAFTSILNANSIRKTMIWSYTAGADKAVLLTPTQNAELDNDLKIDNISGFNDSGSSIFLTLKKEVPVLTPKKDAVPVNVWSYTDSKLQSEQLSDINNAVKFSYMLSIAKANRYTAILPIHERRIIRLEQEHELLFEKRNDLGFIYKRVANADPGERHWNTTAKATVHVISLKDGKRKQLKGLGNREIPGSDISPEGKYIVYYDEKQQEIFSYEVASGVIRSITQGISTFWLSSYGNELTTTARGVAGWMDGDKAVLLYDRHDIWRVDLEGKNPPVNITNGYGHKHNIIFNIALQDDTPRPISENDVLLLYAFNLNNKDNGFYRKRLSNAGDPELLTMDRNLYEVPNNPYIPQGSGFPVVKAANAAVYLVRRMSATAAPNYFLTTDFKNFTAISDLYPEKQYNWYTTELHSWETLDGRTTQGILYKPENFDANKKYPIIFYYYERKSDGLHAYLKPEILPSGCVIDIPTYVSNGYLVFCPDIHYPVGDPMQGTYNSVVSAATYISQLSFVDTKKMGLQGCSLGGIQTNYLVTHTGIFAAACSASGSFNFISHYDALAGNGSSLQSLFEMGALRMGGNLWEIPDKYIKNSPIFKAHNVTTPLLLMHTTNDGVCPFANAVEFFTALRRLGKKVWMLEYTDGDHGVSGKSAVDFSIRMAQFFDHYLKDARPPKWMTQGIPAKMKGIDDGLTLDNSVQDPGPGLLAEELHAEENEKKAVENVTATQIKPY